MPYGETKVYFDGSHYIAIPHTTMPCKRRLKPPDETIVVIDEVEDEKSSENDSATIENDVEVNQEPTDESAEEKQSKRKVFREVGRKEVFEEQ